MKKQRTFCIFLTILLVASLFAGCQVNGGEEDTHSLTGGDIAYTAKKDLEIETTEFDLGTGEYTASWGAKMPYRLRGTLSLPKTEKDSPLVLILHGSHDNENPDAQLYKGFDYLTKALAKEGYAAIALDVQPAYVWAYGDNDEHEKIPYLVEKHIERLQAALDGTGDFPIDITGRIDLNRIVLLGHSRGGDIALQIAQKEERVVGVLAVAPANTVAGERTWRSIPYAMLVPELDGDVTEYDAFNYWQGIRERSDKLLAITMLKGANHNGFNDKLTLDDSLMLYDEKALEGRIDAGKQQSFLACYTLDFLRLCMGEDIAGTPFDLTKPTGSMLYGQPARTLFDSSRFVQLADVTSRPESTDLTVEPLTDAALYQEDSTSGFHFSNGKTNLWNIRWEKTGGSVAIPTEKLSSDSKGLALTFVADPSDKANTKKATAFSIVLGQKDGSTVKVIAPEELTAMEVRDGENTETEIDGKIYYSWSYSTPPSTLIVPFAWMGVKAEDVVSVRLVFDQTESGGIMVTNLSAYS